MSLLGFPALCSLICSTVSHKETEKCIFQGCFSSVTALLMAAILSRLESFPAHTLNIPSIKLAIVSSPSPLFLRKAAAGKSYSETCEIVGVGSSESSTQFLSSSPCLSEGIQSTPGILRLKNTFCTKPCLLLFCAFMNPNLS